MRSVQLTAEPVRLPKPALSTRSLLLPESRNDGIDPAAVAAELAEQERSERLAQRTAELEAKARDDGYRAGYAEGLRAAEAAWQSRLSSLAAIVDAIEVEAARAQEAIEDDIVAIAFEATTRLLDGSRLTVERVINIVDGIRRERPGPEPLTLHLSPDDYELMVTDPLFVTLEDDKKRVKLVEDPAVAPGDCSVRAAHGIRDCSLQSRLVELEKAFLDARSGLAHR
jgi:flagellar assembly protein FliH